MTDDSLIIYAHSFYPNLTDCHSEADARSSSEDYMTGIFAAQVFQYICSNQQEINGLAQNLEKQPSGALLVAVGDCYLKIAGTPHAKKIRAQIQWLEHAWAMGIRCVPEVLQKFSDRSGFVGYLMPRYAQSMPRLEFDTVAVVRLVLHWLEDIWRVPQLAPQSVDWFGYSRRITYLLAQYDVQASIFFKELSRGILQLNLGNVESCTVHGDPTFENIVFQGERFILLDPNPQTVPAVCIPEFDFAKVMQSVCGWEAFVQGQQTELELNEELVSLVAARFGPTGWPTCLWLLITHLVRTLPYGANVGDARRLLPTINKFLSVLHTHLDDCP